MKEGSGNETFLSLCELSEGNLQGGLINTGPWRIYNRGGARETGISLHRRPSGNLEGGSFTGDFER